MKTDIPHLIKNGIRILCNTENFVLIVVPGLSSSPSGSSLTSKTPSKQESYSSSSSSVSSSSPTVSKIQIREREDGSNSDTSPIQCKCQLRLMIDQGNLMKPKPIKSKNQLKRKPRLNGATRCVLRSRSGCKNSGKFWRMMKFQYTETLMPVLLMKFLESRLQRDVRIWVSTVFTLISLKTEIARSVNGPKLQGPHAEDAVAKPYLVLKNLVI